MGMGNGNGEWGMGNGEKMLFQFPTPHSPLPILHFFPPDIWASIEAEPPP
jgi:hypothetical protein